MANLNMQELFDQKVRAFGAVESSQAFQEAFMYAIKSVLADLRIKAFVTVTTPTDYTGTLGLDADYYASVVSAGMDYYIQNHGDWMRKPEGRLYGVYQEALKDAQLYYLREVNDTNEARLGDLTD